MVCHVSMWITRPPLPFTSVSLAQASLPCSLVCVTVQFLAVLQLGLAPVDAISLAPVYWNISNPMFKSSKNDHIIEVDPFDEIDFVCPHTPADSTHHPAHTPHHTLSHSPHHPAHTPHHPAHSAHNLGQSPEASAHDSSNGAEFYLIYRVSRREYDSCAIYPDEQTILLLNCSQPRHKRRFTILFEPFQSIPNVLEYRPGQSYYFISPSTGHRSGLSNLHMGACHHHNMKLIVRVRADSFNALDPVSHPDEWMPPGEWRPHRVTDSQHPADVAFDLGELPALGRRDRPFPIDEPVPFDRPAHVESEGRWRDGLSLSNGLPSSTHAPHTHKPSHRHGKGMSTERHYRPPSHRKKEEQEQQKPDVVLSSATDASVVSGIEEGNVLGSFGEQFQQTASSAHSLSHTMMVYLLTALLASALTGLLWGDRNSCYLRN